MYYVGSGEAGPVEAGRGEHLSDDPSLSAFLPVVELCSSLHTYLHLTGALLTFSCG